MMPWAGDLIPGRKKRDISLPHRIQASSEAHPMDTSVSFPKSNAAKHEADRSYPSSDDV